MTNRRVLITGLRVEGDKLIGTVRGLAGEEFESEIYQPNGLSMYPSDEGESVTVEQNGDPDNFISLPSGGKMIAKEGETVLYSGATRITLNNNGEVKIEGAGKITTDMDFETTGDIKAGDISLKEHVHGGVQTGGGTTTQSEEP